MIHHTRGVYPNGDYKDNGVAAENLEGHKEYNLTFRPGRAFFVDGVCIYKGLGVPDALISKHTGQIRKFDRDTMPYV